MGFALRWAAASMFFALSIASCATPPPPPPKEIDPADRVIDGVRQSALTPEEVEAKIVQQRQRIVDCYGRERYNSLGAPLANFVFRLEIPTTGSAPKVSRMKATIEGQTTLETCVRDVLSQLRFPAHIGSVLKIDVPISGPS